MPRAKRGPKPDAIKSKQSAPIEQVPKAPSDLGKHGKDYWASLAPQLIELGILTPLHLETFRVLCETYHEYKRLNEWLEADPERYYFTTQTGYQQETPQVRLRDKALANLQRMWLKFGMTPHALAQLGKHGGVGKKQLPKIAQFAKKKYEE